MWDIQLSKKKAIVIWSILILLSLGIVFAAIPLLLRIAMNPYLYFSVSSSIPPAQAAMVLGASVEENKVLSPILADRADAAVQLYKGHIVSKILVSGDNATVSYNEVSTVGRYLLQQ